MCKNDKRSSTANFIKKNSFNVSRAVATLSRTIEFDEHACARCCSVVTVFEFFVNNDASLTSTLSVDDIEKFGRYTSHISAISNLYFPF